MGAVVPFPRARHRPFIARHAASIAELPAARGERYLSQQVARQRDVMRRRGIAPERIELEARAFELAIRAMLWRLVLTGGDAA